MDFQVSRANKFVAEKYLLNFLCVRCSESLSLGNEKFLDENSCCAAGNCSTMLQTLAFVNRGTFSNSLQPLTGKTTRVLSCLRLKSSIIAKMLYIYVFITKSSTNIKNFGTCSAQFFKAVRFWSKVITLSK